MSERRMNLDEPFFAARIELEVNTIDEPKINCTVKSGGELSNNKGINRRGGGLSAGALTDKDREDLKAAAAMQVDYLAISFVRNASEISASPKPGFFRKLNRTDLNHPGSDLWAWHRSAGKK